VALRTGILLEGGDSYLSGLTSGRETLARPGYARRRGGVSPHVVHLVVVRVVSDARETPRARSAALIDRSI
jgi:hypothetical protein